MLASSMSKTCSAKSGRARKSLLIILFLANEEMFFVHFSRDRNVKETNHHLVVALFAPFDRTVGIGVVRVVLGICGVGQSTIIDEGGVFPSFDGSACVPQIEPHFGHRQWIAPYEKWLRTIKLPILRGVITAE
jgi:hypothetical protein